MLKIAAIVLMLILTGLLWFIVSAFAELLKEYDPTKDEDYNT